MNRGQVSELLVEDAQMICSMDFGHWLLLLLLLLLLLDECPC